MYRPATSDCGTAIAINITPATGLSSLFVNDGTTIFMFLNIIDTIHFNTDMETSMLMITVTSTVTKIITIITILTDTTKTTSIAGMTGGMEESMTIKADWITPV